MSRLRTHNNRRKRKALKTRPFLGIITYGFVGHGKTKYIEPGNYTVVIDSVCMTSEGRMHLIFKDPVDDKNQARV